jgi:hypothetical protein
MVNTKFKPGQSENLAGLTKDKTPATMIRKAITEDMSSIITTLAEFASLMMFGSPTRISHSLCLIKGPSVILTLILIKEV